jgi:trimeric autotransporter adhesin
MKLHSLSLSFCLGILTLHSNKCNATICSNSFVQNKMVFSNQNSSKIFNFVEQKESRDTVIRKTMKVDSMNSSTVQFNKNLINPQSNIIVENKRTSNNIDTGEQYSLFSVGNFFLEDTTFSQNIGRSAGINNSGLYTINLGYKAGMNNEELQSINIGYNSGMDNQSYQSVNIGTLAGKSSKQNFAVNIGAYAGQNNDGYNNINLGFQSGMNTVAYNNIHIGVNSGKDNAANNSILIGNNAGGNNHSLGSSSISLGYFTGQNNKGNNLIALGENAGQNNEGSFAILMGYNVGINNKGTQVIGIGYNNLMNNSGFANTSIGFGAGQSVTTGSRNAFFGTEAALQSTTGENNTYLGFRAGFNNATGNGNTFVGESANDQSIGGDDNTLVGREAFHDNYTGNFNVALGSYSMHGAQNIRASEMISGNEYSIRDRGIENLDFTALGASSNTIGTIFVYNGQSTLQDTTALVRDRTNHPNYNIAIGYRAGNAVGTGSGNIFIGANTGNNYSQYGKSNKLIIDNKNTLTPLIGGDFSTNELEIGGVTKFSKKYPVSGIGVSNGSLFYGEDGGLYFKGGSGTVTMLAAP